MSGKMSVPLLQKYAVRLRERLVVKVVAFDEADLEFAERIRRVLPAARMYLSAGTPQAAGAGITGARLDVCSSFEWLCGAVLARPALHSAILGLQMHVLSWGRELGR